MTTRLRRTIVLLGCSALLILLCSATLEYFSASRGEWMRVKTITLLESRDIREGYWQYLSMFDAKTAYVLFSRAVENAPVVIRSGIARSVTVLLRSCTR